MEEKKNICIECRNHLEAFSEHLDLKEEELDILQTPRKIIQFKVPLIKDSGEKVAFDGFRVQYNNVLGPTKGGIRFHEMVHLDEVKLLSFLMTLKCSLAGLPYGGSKGGIKVKAEELSEKELERLSRNYIKEIFDDIGPQKDIPAPDMNTNHIIMDWMTDEYSKIKGEYTPAVITGKSMEKDGIAGRTQATALGGAFALREILKRKNINDNNLTVAIQGFGNVGSNLALILSNWGYEIIAISDSCSAIYNKNGLDIKEILEKQEKQGRIPEVKEAEKITNKELLELECDILAPCAVSHQLTIENAENIKAKIILEMANAPTTPEADEVLSKKNILIIPDILANSGGVIVSYFEWCQNLNKEKWEKEKVIKGLEEKILKATEAVLRVEKSSLRVASNMVSVSRILEAERKRGVL